MKGTKTEKDIYNYGSITFDAASYCTGKGRAKRRVMLALQDPNRISSDASMVPEDTGGSPGGLIRSFYF